MQSNYPVELKKVADTIRSEDMQRAVRAVLPKSISVDFFTEVTIAGIENNPDVLEADRDSLYRSCVAAARRGLLPDKKEGALVVYKTNVGTKDAPRWLKMVQFMPMVEGIIKEMAKAGVEAYAVSVYENDTIELWNDDDGQHVKHQPMVFGEQGNMVGVFACAKTETGRTYVEAMNLKDIQQVAARSKQNTKTNNGVSYGGTWRSDFDRMSQKSALHRVRKRLPIIDEQALQNLKDMEESSDIDLSTGETPVGTTEVPQQAQQALPSPQTDEIDLKKLRKPRRSRVLEEVVNNNQPPEQKAQQAQQKVEEKPAPKTMDEEWSDVRDDDIV